jgi:hypothetical protein
MKKFLSLSVFTLFALSVFSQDTTSVPKKKKPIDLSNRANDHFLLQLGYTKWAGIPDTINTNGLSKSINVYFMFDFPFKSNPKLSMALGAGVGTDHILFTKTNVGIKENASAIHFTNLGDTNHFKKTKLATAYLEVPVEFRFSADPLNGKGFKFALGVKVGALINAHTRNTKFENKASVLINDYVMKESSKRFMNKTRISGMARIGYANFSLYASYQFTPVFKDGQGPKVNPFSIGLTLSGL